MTTRFLIIDQALRDLKGHHFELSQAVATAALQIGLTPIIAASAQCDAGLPLTGVEILRHFSQGSRDADRSGAERVARSVLSGMPSGIRMPLLRLASNLKPAPGTWVQRTPPKFGAETRSLIDSLDLRPDDHVLIHTLSAAELHALIAAMEDHLDLPWLHVILRRDAEDTAMRDGPSGGLAAALRRWAAHPVLAKRMRAYTDTEALTRQHQALSHSLPIATLPIPLAPIDVVAADQPRKDGPLRIACLGDARMEKGFHLLPPLLDALRVRFAGASHPRLLVQAHAGFSLNDAIIAQARRALRRAGSDWVEMYEQPLEPAAYRGVLLEADIVLLPYDAALYRRRSSGVLAEALAMGRPAIVPAETWMADSAPTDAVIAFRGTADLIPATMRAIEDYSAISKGARSAARVWRHRHSAGSLVAQLIREAG